MRCIKLALSLIAASYGQDDTCNLKCRNGTPCVKGSADFSDHPTYLDGQPLEFHKESHHNGMHCACSHGLTGITCDRIYASCDGNHKCYNGGECIPGIVDTYGNEQLFCDCSRAFDENGNPYVGKFCEHLSKEDCGSEERFCVNDGECNDLSEESPCICMDDFVGPHCEFKKGSVSSCSLDCKNGGQCQFGIPPEASKYHDLDHMFLTNASNSEDLMYCICPDKFSGKMCEIESESCGSDMCYNGGTCVVKDTESGSPSYQCDCSTASNSRIFSGRFCQFQATSTCDEDDTSSSPLFCVNNGRCPTDGSKGCKCDDNFYGIHCDYLENLEDIPSISPSTVSSNAPEAPGGNPTEGNLPTEVPATSAPVEGQPLSVGPSVTPNLDTGDPQPTPTEVTFSPVKNDPQPSPTVDISEPPVTNDPQPSPEEITFEPPVTNDPQPTPEEITFEPPVTNDLQPTPTEITFEPPVIAPVSSITTETPDSNVCKLSCKNNGICRKGQKSLGIIESIAMFIPELNKTSNSDFEHCECLTGFVGLQCEHLMQVCPGRKHVCLHGSKCVNYGEEQICDCSKATDHQLAGRSCQHKSFTSCNKDESEFVQPRSFCVNGGICLKLVSGNQDHPGCECPLEEWTGPHCELHKSTVKTVDDSSTSLNSNLQEQNNSSQSAILAFGILSLIAAIVVSIFTYYREKRNRKKWMREISSNTAPAAPQVNVGPPRDEDGNELHQINIL